MEGIVKLIDYLRNNELTEVELYRTYEGFLKKEKFRGFDEGCDFVRGLLARRRAIVEATRRKSFKQIIEDIEDYVNEKEESDRSEL